MFKPVSNQVKFPELEETILAFWKSHQTYEKSLAQRAGAPQFVFYEGPPTANGLPHPGHCLTRAIKDLFPRYRTMRGYSVRAQGGLGHARAAGRGRGLQGAGHPLQGGDRGVRRRAVHPQVPGERLALHAGVGTADRAAGVLDPSGRGLRHLPPELRRERLVVAEEAVRPRAAVPGPQDRLVVGPGRHGAQQRRSRPGLPRGGRPERLRPLPAGRPAEHVAAGLDHDALDAAQQPVRRRPSRAGLRRWSSTESRANG